MPSYLIFQTNWVITSLKVLWSLFFYSKMKWMLRFRLFSVTSELNPSRWFLALRTLKFHPLEIKTSCAPPALGQRAPRRAAWESSIESLQRTGTVNVHRCWAERTPEPLPADESSNFELWNFTVINNDATEPQTPKTLNPHWSSSLASSLCFQNDI